MYTWEPLYWRYWKRSSDFLCTTECTLQKYDLQNEDKIIDPKVEKALKDQPARTYEVLKDLATYSRWQAANSWGSLKGEGHSPQISSLLL